MENVYPLILFILVLSLLAVAARVVVYIIAIAAMCGVILLPTLGLMYGLAKVCYPRLRWDQVQPYLPVVLVGGSGVLGYLWGLWEIRKGSAPESPQSFCLLAGGIAVVCMLLCAWTVLIIMNRMPGGRILRGAQLTSVGKVQHRLNQNNHNQRLLAYQPQLAIGGVTLPHSLETLGVFCVGSPGSGKTQVIQQLLYRLKQRPDMRAIILDRNGELLQQFYTDGRDILFNPRDSRSVNWSHRSEGMEPETIATALVPDDSKERFFSEAARSLLADLYERCPNNQALWQVVTQLSVEELSTFLAGSMSTRYFTAEKTGASVLSTLVNVLRFYRKLDDEGDFSFSRWARSDDPRWLFLPIFEDDVALFKPLHSMAFELMLKGLLSQTDRRLKTAVVIDELGALNRLNSLPRLLAESRKYGGSAIIGTQTEAQIRHVYGPEITRTILQGTATKVILNCRDGETAQVMAQLLGKQERLEQLRTTRWFGLKPGSRSEHIRETYAVMPTELQMLPPLTGYLSIADGTPLAKVKITPETYPQPAQRYVAAIQVSPR